MRADAATAAKESNPGGYLNQFSKELK